jgi:hypothetical protein
MKANLKVMLSAVGVAALLASPAMAQTHPRHRHVAPATVSVPSDARASAPNGVFRAPETPTYAPDAPAPRSYYNLGVPDFQDGSRG